MNAAPSPTRPPRALPSWVQWADFSSPTGSPLWQRLGWTFVFCAGIAFGFTVLYFVQSARSVADWLSVRDWALWYGRNLGISLVIGYLIQGLFALVRWRVGPGGLRGLGRGRRTLVFMGVPLLGTLLGWPAGMALVFGDPHVVAALRPGSLLSSMVLSLMISSLFLVYFSARVREVTAEARATDARLRLLQGQMEPHFLFNTLANVVSLVDADAPRAKQVLEAFTDYLRASLGSLRREDSTLGAELELAHRYLLLMQARMGERLRFELAVDPALHGAALPPLLLQPLVENAVKHGLEPQVDGGTVRIAAERAVVDGRDSLRLVVDDDGTGLAAAAARPRRRAGSGADGNGIALANLHERLATSFGAGGRLVLEEHAGAPGTRACLVLPWRDAPPAPASASPARA